MQADVEVWETNLIERCGKFCGSGYFGTFLFKFEKMISPKSSSYPQITTKQLFIPCSLSLLASDNSSNVPNAHYNAAVLVV